MEEDERVQKLKAGKEKLAQFQKKKKKKKRSSQHNDVAPEVLDVKVGETMDISSTLGTFVAASPDYDSDQQSQSTCSEDETSTEEPTSRQFVRVKSQLQEKNQRVEELEESLAGKQLALDKVIRENEELKKQSVDSREVLENGVQRENLAKIETSPEKHMNQSVVNSGDNQSSHGDGDQSVVKDAGSQQFDLADIQELLQHVQWLQLQLKQANGTLKLQNNRQQQTVGSLHQAREEVLNLKDNIEQKDNLLGQLAEKLTEISSQHESLKVSYQGLLTDTDNKEGQKLESEIAQIKELLQNEYESKLEKLKTDNQETVEVLTEQFQEKITKATSELNEKVDQLETENIELKTDKDVHREQSEKLVSESETLKLENESLTKGLEILKKENENSTERLEEVLKEKEHLENEHVQIMKEKDAVQTELENIRLENEELGLLKDKLKTIQVTNENLEQMVQTLEEIKNENSSLLIENQNLADEVGKLKEDNLMYQTQLTEHEDKISQNGDIMEENLSLRVQNDELYNKINNQKDIIASLRGELELLTCENAQLVGQVKDHTEEEDKYKNDIKDLLLEKDELKSVVEDVKTQLEVVFAENILHNDNITSLESEISKLKHNLEDLEVSKDTATNIESDKPVSKLDVDEEVFPNAVKTTLKPIEEHFLMPETILPVEEDIVHSENIQRTSQMYPQNGEEAVQIEETSVQPNTNIENSIIRQIKPELEAMYDPTQNSDVPKPCDSVMSFTNHNQTEVNDSVCDNSAKSDSEANSKITALQLEVQSLTDKLQTLQENSSIPADEAAQREVFSSSVQTVDGNNELGGVVHDELNDTEKTASACHEDTAYQSISEHSDSQTVADLENDLRLKHQQIQTLQEDLDKVTELLHEKQDQCDNLQSEIEQLKDSSNGSLHVPRSNSEIVNDAAINLPSQQAVTEEVSELVFPSSLQTLEMEVNLHASSTPSQGGTFSIESNGVVGDVGRETRNQGQSSQNDIESVSLSSVKLDDVAASGVTEEDDGSKNVSDDGVESTETNDQSDRKSRKDFDNQSKATSHLQQEVQSLQSSLEKSQQNNETLKHEHEKIQWERDELVVKLQSVDSELEKMKAVICDKEQNEEDYVTVKERLEFLESTATDCFEMKEMLDKIQEEKENILKDNESLQCSLSAHIGENEQILKRLETLTVENQKLEKDVGVILSDVCKLQENLKSAETGKAEFESKLTETIERENRLAAENEGLLEENSTLKTKAHCLNADLETIREENIRLNSFFPDVDKKSDENKNLKLQQNTLETKISEISKENESLVEEIMEQERKLTNMSEENETWASKCEQLQQIIEEMDDEKTGLLNTIEWSEANNTERIKQKESEIEKLEMQLCGLDEENSTLKTQILGLKQDLEEVQSLQDNILQLQKENETLKSENAEFRDNMLTLEQDLLDLEEQTKKYEQTVASKSELTTSLKNDLSKILQENCSLKEKCSSLSHDLNDLKTQESLLKEQLKVHENSVSNASESNSQELNSLSAQIELEMKYKTKLQADLEKCQELLNVLERDKLKLSDELSVAYKDIHALQTTKQEDEKIMSDLSTELETARVEKEELLVEMTTVENDHQTMLENNKKLSEEVEMIQGHLQAVSENRNHIRNQTEVLVSEIEYLSMCRDSLTSYVHNVRIKNNELLLENHELKRNNEELTVENEKLKTINESNCVSDTNNEQSDSKEEMEEQCAHLSKKVDNLNEQLGVSEQEKQELENLTEDLTNMLRDMQTKYEEVKSEMESTKKTCDKEIGQLQSQLQVMNEDVSQLRKMLDLMENEMYHASEEKSVLKENLEQQQAQYVVAVEEKQLLEEKLSEKNEKDRKNMATASKINQLEIGATAAETPSASSDSVGQDSTMNTSSNSNVFVPIRDNEQDRSDVQMISHFSEEHAHVPSFQSALHFMDLQSQDSKLVNSSSQTNITVDISGHFGDSSGSEKVEKCLETTGTQTEMCENGYQVINNGTQQEIEQEECQTPAADDSVPIKVQTNNSIETDITLSNSESQTDLLPSQSASCQTDIQESTKTLDTTDSEVSYSDKERLHDFEKESDCSALEYTGEDISIVSHDSGVLTASMGTENEILRVKADVEDEQTVPNDQCERSAVSECSSETQAQTSDTDTLEVKSECNIIEAEKEDECNVNEQRTISAKIKELEQTYDEKLQKIEDEVLKKVTEKLDFREKMIKAQEDSYEKKVKRINYDLEEEYEFKFRQREAELMVEADSYKKQHAKEVEHAAELKIEKIRKEKDQQFVETLQKVKSDLTRRHGSHRPRKPDADPGPGGDASVGEDSPQVDEDVRKLRIDNKDLASARDALLQKIDLSQQEQTAFHENLLSIMGDENSMKLSPQTPGQRMPAWLDWNLVPDISFDSVTSSIDAKSLSGSLDPSSFCSNSDCLSMRMRYEQLIEKIEQYLKLRPSTSGEVHDEEAVGIDDEVDAAVSDGHSGSKQFEDRFIESNEADSQVLQRITSIHLEHFVRVPSEQTETKEDQFVHESEGTEQEVETNEDIIQAIVKESSSQAEYIGEGHFSENESDNEDNRIESINDSSDQASRGHFIPAGKSQFSSKDDEGHFCGDTDEDDDNPNMYNMNVRRHFSESDAQLNKEPKLDIKTSQSDKVEGHFVQEKSTTLMAIAGKNDDPEAFDSKTTDDVFEPMSSKKTKAAKRSKKSKKRKRSRSEKNTSESDLMPNRFIAEASAGAEKCPGFEQACIVADGSRDTHTGEGIGDFVEEKIIKVEHVRNLNSEKPSFFSDSIVVEKQSLSSDENTRVESGDILEAISQEVEAQDKKFEPPAERTESPDFVIEPDIKHVPLKSKKNSKSKKKAKFAKEVLSEPETESRDSIDARQNLTVDLSSMQPQFSSGKQSYENTVFDILNSICPGTDPSRIRGEFRPAENQFEATADQFSELPSELDELQELKKQNEVMKAALKEAKADKETLEREIVDKDTVLQELQKERSLSQSNEQVTDEKLKEIEQLCKLNKQLKEESAMIKAHRDSLECKVNKLSSTIELTENNLEKAKQTVDDISCKLANTEARSNEIESLMKELQNEKEELTTTRESLNRNIQKHHEENAQLVAQKDALEKENLELQDKSSMCAKLENEIAKVKDDISVLKIEKGTLTEEFESEREKLRKEKVEVENVLIAQADMYEKLVADKKHIEESVVPKIQDLENQIDCLQSQNEEVTAKFDIEKQLTDQLMAKEKESNDEVLSLKTTKNELNSVLASLTAEVQDVQNSLQQKVEEICKLEQEKDMMNDKLKEYSNISEQRSETLKENKVRIDEMIKENERNECTITSLQNETSNLNSTIQELTEKVTCLAKSNDDLKARKEQSEQNQTQIDRTLEEQDRLLLQVQHLEDERNKWNMGCKELAQMMNCLVKETDDKISNKTLHVPSKGNFTHLDGEMDSPSDVMSDEKRIPEVLEDLTFKVTALITENDSLKQGGHDSMNKNEDQLRSLAEEKNLRLEQTQHLKEQKDELQRMVEELNEKVTTLMTENEKVKAELKDYIELRADKEHLIKELSNMKERNLEDEWAIKELARQIEALETEKQAFEKDKTDLQKEGGDMHVMKLELEKLKEENMALHESLEVEKQSLEKNKTELQSDGDNMQVVNLELDKLKQENSALKTRLENLENNSDTENDVQILQELKEALKLIQDEKSALESELGDKTEKFERENLTLSNEVEKLQEDNDNLKKKHNSREETLKKENADILKMYSDLRNEVEVLVISKHDLEIELHALKDLLEHESESGDTSQIASRDSSRELTIQDLEEMEDLKSSIEKLKSDLKEKDSYVRKLEEHLLNINRGLPELTSNPKPTSSRGEPVLSRRHTRKRPMWLEYGRRALSHDLPCDAAERSKHELHKERSPSFSESTTEGEGSFEHNVLSEQQFVAGLDSESKFKSSVCSETRSCSTLSESFEVTEKVKSGLSAKEDGHVALEQKQFELVEEITTLRRDFRETKALYAQEAALLTEALEKEKSKKDLLESSRERNKSGSSTAHDLVRSKQEVARLKDENKMLRLESERWLSRLKDQEQVVLELKEKLSRNTSGIEEIEEVFGRQLALLQKQREELVDKLKERDIENYKLSTSLGEKGIIEETLRRDKDVLLAKLQEQIDLESELNEYKVHFEKQICKQKQLEETVNQKDHSEMQLMKQKRVLEEELHEIESKFKDREENLETEKNRLLDELRDRRSVHISTYITEGDDETKSLCTAGAYLTDNNNIGRIEKMLEDVEKEHSHAVRILRDQLKTKYSRREQMLREEQAEGMKKLQENTEEQLEKLKEQYDQQLQGIRSQLDDIHGPRRDDEDGPAGEGSTDSQQIYQQAKEELGKSLPGDQKDQLDSLVSDMDKGYQQQMAAMQRQHVDDVDNQVHEIRNTLEEIYNSQIQVVRSELEQSHQVVLLEQRETLDKDHKQEINKLNQQIESLETYIEDEERRTTLENVISKCSL